MTAQAILVGCLHNLSSLQGGRPWPSAKAKPSWLLVRADRVPVHDVAWLRSHFSGTLIFSLGNPAPDSGSEALARRCALLRAAAYYDLFELDAQVDIEPGILRAIPSEKRIVSWKGAANSLEDLLNVFDRISRIPARYYKLVTDSADPGNSILPLAFLRTIRRADTFAWAGGEAGMWTRLIAPRVGAPIVFGHLRSGPPAESGERTEPGEPSLLQLIEDYGFPALKEIGAIYGIAGANVLKSLSPRLHNAAYAELRRDAVFLPFQTSCFDTFRRTVVESSFFADTGMPIKGLTLATPHKEMASDLATWHRPLVRRARSSNIQVRESGGWMADTTDPDGVIPALRDNGFCFRRAAVAVVGCGGSGRAVAAALCDAGSQVTLVNRSLQRGHAASRMLGLPFVPLNDFEPGGYAAVINATPVGGSCEEMPFSTAGLAPDAIVLDHVYVDHVYREGETPLIQAARALGCRTVNGREVLLAQVRRQFQLMTGDDLPLEPARHTLGLPTASEAFHPLAAAV